MPPPFCHFRGPRRRNIAGDPCEIPDAAGVIRPRMSGDPDHDTVARRGWL